MVEFAPHNVISQVKSNAWRWRLYIGSKRREIAPMVVSRPASPVHYYTTS